MFSFFALSHSFSDFVNMDDKMQLLMEGRFYDIYKSTDEPMDCDQDPYDKMPLTPPSSTSRSATPTVPAVDSINFLYSNEYSSDLGKCNKEIIPKVVDSQTSQHHQKQPVKVPQVMKRKGRPRNMTTIKLYNIKKDSNDLYDSSDETFLSRALERLVPTPNHFDGKNNPFSVENGQILNNKNNESAGQTRIVRTIRRRLSAKDIVIGPNMEVKKLRRRTAGARDVDVSIML